jgi:hypothetical protein
MLTARRGPLVRDLCGLAFPHFTRGKVNFQRARVKPTVAPRCDLAMAAVL